MELTSGQSSARPNNGKKRPLNLTEGPSQERKPKAIVPYTPAKSNCKHCDKPGHTADECWRKAGTCLHCGSREHRIPECPLLKENESRIMNATGIAVAIVVPGLNGLSREIEDEPCTQEDGNDLE
ncbi:hypothetical protein Taro_007586 [Colocasia esculenta]|uniref:CCHC-type domain-containing protein n=1 Tax=Colocasia esculenta TaxID=4460 RepID=A0A843TVV0_COLES|nr:hypothetical protein [Colocasia esculenta]